MKTLLVVAGHASARIRLSDLRLQWRELLREVLVDGRPMITEGDDSTRLSQPAVDESSHQGSNDSTKSRFTCFTCTVCRFDVIVLISLLVSIKCNFPTLSNRTGVMKRLLWPYGEILRRLSI